MKHHRIQHGILYQQQHKKSRSSEPRENYLHDVGVRIGHISDWAKIEKFLEVLASLVFRTVIKNESHKGRLMSWRGRSDRKKKSAFGVLTFVGPPRIEGINKGFQMHWREGKNPRIDVIGMGIGLICELCNDTEVTTSACGVRYVMLSCLGGGNTADGPEEVAVDFGVGSYDFTGGENHFYVTKVVNHQAILSCALAVDTHVVHSDSRIPRRGSILQCQYH